MSIVTELPVARVMTSIVSPTKPAAAYPDPAMTGPTSTAESYPLGYPGATPTPTTSLMKFPFVAVPVRPTPTASQPYLAQAIPAKPGTVPQGFVQARGDQLVLGGETYHFLGVNATYLTLTYFLDDQVEPIIRYLAETQGVNVLRIWLVPGQDPDRLERILDLGNKYNLRYIVALQNYHYYKSQSWFAMRYKEEDLPHVRAVVSRFRTRPEILMWELMNEPGCGPENGSKDCTDHMYRWAEDVSRVIKEIDPHHLVSIGTTLRGWTKYEQRNYDRMHALPTVDVVSIHRRVGKTARSEMRVAEKLNKPIFVGEVYYRAYNSQCRPLNNKILAKRADYIAKDLAWSFQHGLDGYLLWQHDPGAIPVQGDDKAWFCEANSYLVGDPVYEVFKTYLARFRLGEGFASEPVGPDE